MTQGLHVRLAGSGDEDILRALRIQALTESPRQFSSTLERERARTPEAWARWFAPGATFLLERGGEARGLVAATAHVSRPGDYFVESMWVHPRERGGEAADLLMGALQVWAEAEGAPSLWLEVVEDNVRARRFYREHGFAETGERRSRQGRMEVEMRFAPESGKSPTPRPP